MSNPWDKNAEIRHKQILEGKDLSFSNVLAPSVINNVCAIKNIAGGSVLDIGCGSGILAQKLAKRVKSIIGIDPSQKSIEIANREYGNIKNLSFHCVAIENFNSPKKFQVVVSNMTLQTIKNINPVLKSVTRHMTNTGQFIFSIPHPCFWADYRKKINPEDFKNYTYRKNSRYKISFSISKDRTPLPSSVPYYHRRLETYEMELRNAGLRINQIIEPFPVRIDEEHIKKYWDFPHFIIFICGKRLQES